jgi:hypothetical protein
MPLQTGKDNEGCFIKYGDQGTKYHYKCGDEVQRKEARKKAIAQAVAIGEFAEQSYNDYPDSVKKVTGTIPTNAQYLIYENLS